jgi:hypothetical protein
MMQLLATILFFIVFIQLFVSLSLYLFVTIRNFIKEGEMNGHEHNKVEDSLWHGRLSQ